LASENTHVKEIAPSDQTTVRRGILKAAGVYIEGTIEGVEVTFTVDTGAEQTTISERVFR
jgi:predicted aspartyl protease